MTDFSAILEQLREWGINDYKVADLTGIDRSNLSKLRESLNSHEINKLSGEVEIDGCYVNKHIRPTNRIEHRIDRRLARHQNPKKRAVIVMRQRGEKGEGAIKTLTFLAKCESQRTTRNLAQENIEAGSTVFADDHKAYDVLHADFNVLRVNHKAIYTGPAGENTNQAESYFARFRRMQYGQHHKFGNPYILRYSNEAAYREDTRHVNNGEIFHDITKRCATKGVSRDFCGYWQGNKKTDENLV